MGKAREASNECQQGVPRGSGGPLSTPGPLLGSSTSSQPPQIVINPARRKMLQKLALYEDGVLDSLQLLSSSSLPGTLQEQWPLRSHVPWAQPGPVLSHLPVLPILPLPVVQDCLCPYFQNIRSPCWAGSIQRNAAEEWKPLSPESAPGARARAAPLSANRLAFPTHCADSGQDLRDRQGPEERDEFRS